jgi:hypothetical protein
MGVLPAILLWNGEKNELGCVAAQSRVPLGIGYRQEGLGISIDARTKTAESGHNMNPSLRSRQIEGKLSNLPTAVAVITISALWACHARAQPASAEPRALAQEEFICRLPGAPDRRIGVYRPTAAPQRCRVDYTRDGKTRSLWSSGHDYKFCVKKALEIVGLLEGVDFKCSPQAREAPGGRR